MKPRVVFTVVLLALVAALLAACAGTTNSAGGSAASPTAQSQHVQVTVSNDRMNLSQTTFSAGVPYHFAVTNKGALQQECMIMPHAMGQMPMDQVRHQALMTTNVIIPGMTQAFEYTFPSAMGSQQLQLTCYANNGPATVSMPMQIR